MNARFLMVIFDSVFLVAMTAWVGSILFFSFCVAPIIFKVLGAEAGGRFVRVLFPRYYMWGAISGAVALPAMVAVPLAYPTLRGPSVGVSSLVLIAGVLLMLYAGNSLTPAINAARDGGPARQAEFDRLHKRSVRLNALVLLLGLGLLVGFAARPFPNAGGIVELSPLERVQKEAEWLKKQQSGENATPRPAPATR